MISRYKTIIIISCILIIVFILFSVLIKLNNDRKFTEILNISDNLISTDSYDEIDKLLFDAAKLANSPFEFKQLLKRLHNIKSFNNLALFSENAYNKYPKDNEILSIYIYSLLKTKQNQLANNIFHSLKQNNLPEALIYETTIKTGSFISDDNIFYRALKEKNISLFNKLYQLTHDKKFLINSVLLNLEKGNFNKADIILSGIKPDNLQNKKLLLLTKYDNGKYEEVLNLLMLYDFDFTTEEMLLIQIDISLKIEGYNEALVKITDFIKLYTDYSVIPYINIIYLSSFTDVPDIIEYMQLAYDYFPNNRALNLILIEYHILQDNEKIALELVNKYSKKYPQDKEFEIIYKQLIGAADPEKFLNNIYELINRNPQNIFYSRYLAWSLFQNNNFEDLENYLNSPNVDDDVSWVYFFQALLSMFRQEDINALEQFQNAYNGDKNWETLYNMGIITAFTRDFQSSIEYFQNSENNMNNIPDNLKIKSFIRTTLASTFYDMQKYNNAFREVTNALELDNSNLKAHLLLKKLESSNY